MAWALAAVVLALLVGAWAAWFARRLDRLHVRVDSARVALVTQLDRRAGAADTLARHARTGGPGSGTGEAALAVGEAVAGRGSDGLPDHLRENDVSRAVRALVAALLAAGAADPAAGALVDDLETATHRVALARAFYNGAVDDTRKLRRARVVRWLRLAGRAPLPAYFEIDDAPVAVVPGVPQPRGGLGKALPTG